MSSGFPVPGTAFGGSTLAFLDRRSPLPIAKRLEEPLPITKRLEEIEKIIKGMSEPTNTPSGSSPLASKIVQTQQSAAVSSVLSTYTTEAQQLKQNFIQLVKYTVSYVELNAPIIIEIIGGTVTGDFKLNLCIELITNISTELPIEINLLKEIINEIVDLMFNQPTTKCCTSLTSKTKKKKNK